jgi:hypothetical protein
MQISLPLGKEHVKDVRIYCDGDGCGERIVEARTNLKVMCGAIRNRAVELDFCPVCAAKLSALIGHTPPSTLEPAARRTARTNGSVPHPAA